MQRVSSPSRRNCSSISLVVNLFCLAFILLVFLLLCLFSSVLSAFAKDALVERDASLSPDFARISRRRRLFGRDPFNQNSNRSDREKWSTSKGGPVFSKRLDQTDPLSFGPKFPEILVEWIAPFEASLFGGGRGVEGTPG